ncbi:MAG: DUF3786 domain-containing protein [Candidatus Sulfobium sp.]|jgi:hypothetical protein
MNPLDLYKKLPRENCGKCGFRTCMPFALSVITGDAVLADCPLLSEEERGAIESSLSLTDWRQDLIRKLREEVEGMDFSQVAEGIGAEVRGSSLFLTCMGREFTISPEGDIVTRGHMTPWIKILLLHYVRTKGTGELTGKWTSFGELKSGMVKASSFERDCEEPLRQLFDSDFGRVEKTLLRMGAERRADFPTESAWYVRLLPRIPVAILYWPAEEDFPSKVKILFDSSADRFLDAESMIFLVEGLVRNVELSH